MNPSLNKLRLAIAAALCSISVVCFVYAAPVTLTQDQEIALKQCQDDWHKCWTRCHPHSYESGPDVDACIAGCGEAFKQCLKDHGIPPAAVKHGPGSPVQQVSPPPKSNPNKPRPGPGQTAPPNKSHPTPTPRKGPGNVSQLPKGSPSSSATTPPVLLKKSASPTPTPKK